MNEALQLALAEAIKSLSRGEDIERLAKAIEALAEAIRSQPQAPAYYPVPVYPQPTYPIWPVTYGDNTTNGALPPNPISTC